MTSFTIRLRPMTAWYDLWVGAFIDLPKKRVYVFPFPCIGVCIEWGHEGWDK